jgi:hypothetical protein
MTGEEDSMTRFHSSTRHNSQQRSATVAPSVTLLAATLLAAILLAALLTAACSVPAPETEGEIADAGTNAPPAPASPAEPPAPATDAAPTMCTQIGCSDGLNVELDGFDEEVELELTAGEETRRVTCLPPGPCRHFIPDFTPAEVTVVALLEDGTEEERSFTPEYRDEQPNGPDCPPVCRQASIRWKL